MQPFNQQVDKTFSKEKKYNGLWENGLLINKYVFNRM